MIVTAVALGVGVLIAGGLPWSMLLAPANLRAGIAVPWAIVPMAIYLRVYWTYLGGRWGARDTAAARREYLRANPVPVDVFTLSMTVSTCRSRLHRPHRADCVGVCRRASAAPRPRRR